VSEDARPGKNGKIAFASNRATGNGVKSPTRDFWVRTIGPGGSGLFQRTFNTVFDGVPAWSSSGKRVADESGRDGSDDQFAMSATGDRLLNRTRNAATDEEPNWQPT
jgi:hypothetical protein